MSNESNDAHISYEEYNRKLDSSEKRFKRITRQLKEKDPEGKSLIPEQRDFLYWYIEKKSSIIKACQKAGVPRRIFRKWYLTHKKFRQKIDEYTDSLVDVAERRIYEMAEKGSLQAVRYVLDHQGKSRGWGDKEDDSDKRQWPKMVVAEMAILGLKPSANQVRDISNARDPRIAVQPDSTVDEQMTHQRLLNEEKSDE